MDKTCTLDAALSNQLLLLDFMSRRPAVVVSITYTARSMAWYTVQTLRSNIKRDGSSAKNGGPAVVMKTDLYMAAWSADCCSLAILSLSTLMTHS